MIATRSFVKLRLMLSHVQVQQDLKLICPEHSSMLTAQQPLSLTGVKLESNKQVQWTTEKELIAVTVHVCTSRVSMLAAAMVFLFIACFGMRQVQHNQGCMHWLQHNQQTYMQ